jgi:hypothetical protein
MTMKPIDCAEIALVPETGTDRVWLEMTGAAGEKIRAGLSSAHVSTLHQQIHAAFMARNPQTKPGEAKPPEATQADQKPPAA